MKASGIHASSVILIAVVWFLLAGVPAHGMITFERTYGGISRDYGNSVQQTRDEGYVVAGFTESFGAGNPDVYLVKTDSMGDTLWTRTYGGPEFDYAHSVQQTTDGGFVITGPTTSFDAGSADVYLVKTDSIGDTLWTRTYGGPSWDWGWSVQQASDGGYIIAGHTYSFGAGSSDIYLIKTDSKGDTLWTRTYGGTADDIGLSVQQTSDGGYIIAGQTYSFGEGSSDAYLVKTDSIGDTLWTRTYGGTADDFGVSVQQISAGGFIIVGWTGSFGSGSNDVYFIKTDSLGRALWTRTYGGSGDDQGRSVDQTSDGGYVIAGVTSVVGFYDVYLIKTDSLGDSLWTRTFCGTGNPTYNSCSVQETGDGGIIVTGRTDSFGAGWDDVYLIKTDSLGLVVGIQEQDRKLKTEKRKALQNKPNPFQGSTVISYSLPGSAHVTLKVFDITGRLLETLVNEIQEHGSYQVQWNSNDNPSGIYFCRLQAGDFTDTKKMLLLR